ncbi:amidohydrolase [Natronobacterium texcoconense]|uniref:Aminobenzoyl-glutamate utilization protein A n=1 Tax=Natronobacterium texcoconense TaxID=1095778 RepID=A0A1H1ANQ6_NATTX|nr:amidohydrolase [Natronobacterium texcoconense]SDQ41254.1 aminobenzoyl-glutamate utilization protein A [Natronobacterium texcoconense]
MGVTITTPDRSRLVDLRRTFHEYPEPGWCEFWTTARIVDELETIGVDEIHVGPDAMDTSERLGVPDEAELEDWFERARDRYDGDSDVFDKIEGGNTGAVAVLERGEGPTVGLRVDIDALPITEADGADHDPTETGFRSENEGFMHACGHDAHITFGLGTLEAVKDSDFSGTFKVFFQPSEELLGGGKAMAAGPHIDDVEYMIGTHIGLGHSTGEVVAGGRGMLALNRMEVAFEGESSHAGLAPNAGRNAVQAFVTAAENVYAIPRHKEGATRVNVGRLHSTNPANIVADEVSAELEVRGDTTELMEYMRDRVERTLESAAEMHDCSVDYSLTGEAIRHDSDEVMVERVVDLASKIDEVTAATRWAEFGGSEDVTYLMKEASDSGGYATLIVIGTDHPGDHHTPTFDVDEESLGVGVSVLSETALSLFDDPVG